MKTISLKIDSALDHWLESEAKKLGRTKSEIAREALAQRRKGLQKQSIHELMREFCGTIKDGPKDYASNRKYLKGFGR
jgi:predicted transcriptional regulator